MAKLYWDFQHSGGIGTYGCLKIKMVVFPSYFYGLIHILMFSKYFSVHTKQVYFFQILDIRLLGVKTKVPTVTESPKAAMTFISAAFTNSTTANVKRESQKKGVS